MGCNRRYPRAVFCEPCALIYASLFAADTAMGTGESKLNDDLVLLEEEGVGCADV